MRKFAAIFMGSRFIPDEHRAEFVTGSRTCICTVRNMQEARERILALQGEGFGAIELCGAFGRDFAREMISLTGGKIAIGYSVHEPEQDEVFSQFFADK